MLAYLTRLDSDGGYTATLVSAGAWQQRKKRQIVIIATDRPTVIIATDWPAEKWLFESLSTLLKNISPHIASFCSTQLGIDAYGLGGAWLTESLNTSQFTHEVAPAFLLVERILLEKIRHLIGYPVKEEDGGDGIFCPGGSISNM